MHAYDVVVVGAGSAGCVVAARLTENPARRVLLVEAGRDPQPVPDVIADPRRQGEVIRDPTWVRHYPVSRPDGSTFPLVSGRVVGGGSAVNNLSVTRPTRRDFERWEWFGGPAWSYDALLPLMRSIEDDPDLGDQPIHGRGGPLRLRRPWQLDDAADPPVRALLEAAAECDLPRCDDLNGPVPFGICASPYNLVDGRRQTVADAYLAPARTRPNLTILADATAVRIHHDGARASGVDLVTPGGPLLVEAREMVVSAGTYQSPHLLQLSGIGRSGLGENFQDHAVVYLTFEAGPALRDEHRVPKVRLMAKSDPGRAEADLHVLMHDPIRDPTGRLRLPVSVRLLEHRSRGQVRPASADPLGLPVVDPALLRDERDLEALVDGIRLVSRLVAHPALSEFYRPHVEPGPDVDWATHVRSTYVSYNHAVGTCRIGPADDPLAVVDPSLRVHGADNLWVADASVLPVIPHAATNLAAILVGEVAARNLDGA